MTATPLTTAEAAAALGVSRSLVLKLIASGQLKARRHGRDWQIDRSALNAVLPRPKPGPKPKKSRNRP